MTEKKDLKDKVLELAQPLAEGMGLKIWGIEITGGGKLRICVYIDVPEPAAPDSQSADSLPALFSATLSQCEELSRQLGLALEAEDVVPGSWVLEVSSPGLERKFFEPEQLDSHMGDMLEVRLASELVECPGRKAFQGRLLSREGDSFTIEPCAISETGKIIPENAPQCRIPWNQARSVKRIHIFQAAAKPGKKNREK